MRIEVRNNNVEGAIRVLKKKLQKEQKNEKDQEEGK